MITFFFIVLFIGAFMCLYRIAVGPTPPDRMVAIDILGILVVGICALYAAYTGKGFYLYIAISWAILSFVGTLALAKFLEGRSFDE
ncbi:MAG: cation:proton antiporter [candidate division WOR-3 bacterium]|nr:cation:proton antiporter [candidate division WOR-3 bacterium]